MLTYLASIHSKTKFSFHFISELSSETYLDILKMLLKIIATFLFLSLSSHDPVTGQVRTTSESDTVLVSSQNFNPTSSAIITSVTETATRHRREVTTPKKELKEILEEIKTRKGLKLSAELISRIFVRQERETREDLLSSTFLTNITFGRKTNKTLFII